MEFIFGKKLKRFSYSGCEAKWKNEPEIR